MISLSYMKKTIRTACMVALAALICGTVTAPAQDETPAEVESTSTKTSKKKELPAVAQALKKVKFVHGKANSAAKCYVYLQSASWCGPCRKEMPEIVAEYKKMKKEGVEIILCGCDKDKRGVKDYVKEFKIPFPATVADDKLKLPGYTKASGIPHAIFVDKNGKVLASGHGSITMNWQDYLPADDEAEDSEK